MPLKRSAVSAQPSGLSTVPADGGAWAKPYPTVVEFLSSFTWEDGQSRLSGTVMFLFESGVWKLWVHDRDAGASCFVSGKTPTACLDALEKGLVGESLPWRLDKAPSTNGKRRT